MKIRSKIIPIILLLVLMIESIELFNLNSGMMKTLDFNFHVLQDNLTRIALIVKNEDMNDEKSQETAKALIEKSFIAVSNINDISAGSILYQGYCMKETKNFILYSMVNLDSLSAGKKEKLLQLCESFQAEQFGLPNADKGIYNFILDRQKIKKSVMKIEERFVSESNQKVK